MMRVLMAQGHAATLCGTSQSQHIAVGNNLRLWGHKSPQRVAVQAGLDLIRVKLSAGRYRNINRFSWLIQALT